MANTFWTRIRNAVKTALAFIQFAAMVIAGIALVVGLWWLDKVRFVL